MRIISLLIPLMLSSLAYSQAVIPVLQNPTSSQTIVQPSGTTLSVNRMENIRYAEQFANAPLCNSACACGGGASATGGIQEAICDLPSGGTVIIPPGTTTISTTVAVNKPVKIVGYGWPNTTVTSTQTSGDEFLVTVGGAILQDFFINRVTTPSSGSGVHFSCSCNELELLRMRIYNQYNGVVTDSSTWYLFVDSSVIDTNANDGIDIAGNGTRFTKNRIYYNIDHGMLVTAAAGMISSDNEYFANQNMGIQYYGNGTAQAFHTGDIIDSSGSNGIGVQNMADFSFTDGWIASSGVNFNGRNPNYSSFKSNLAGAFCDQSTTRCRFNNNQVTNNSGEGLLFYGAQTFEASDNQIFSNGQGERLVATALRS